MAPPIAYTFDDRFSSCAAPRPRRRRQRAAPQRVAAAIEQGPLAEEAALLREPQEPTRRRGIVRFFRRNLARRFGAALALWRIEARFATPLAFVLIATIGRWPAALAMGSIMAAYSALFLFLLEGEKVMDELRHWLRGRRWFQRHALPIAERRDRVGALQRALSIPASVMLMGPFWRAVTYHVFRMPRLPAYALSVGGSFPHSLFWTGLVLGGLWEVAIRPLLERII